jgi:parallel beta-helix repeat protein
VRYNEAYAGGGIDTDGNISIIDSRIESNTSTASSGGGLSLRGSNTARIEDTVIMGNYSNHSGGGLFVNYPILDMLRCEVSYNTAQNNGGGLYAGTSTIRVTNTTFSSNYAYGSGGGLHGNHFYGDSHLSFCTITHNFADSDADGTGDGGGIYADLINYADHLELKGSVVAKNSDMSPPPGAKLAEIAISGACAEHLQSFGNNFIGANDGAEAAFPAGYPNVNGDYVGTSAADLDPGLASLADNGGPSETHATLAGSPLINRGPVPCTDVNDSSVTVDQRGQPRPIGRADIGAFEGAFGGVNPGPGTSLLLLD